MRRESLNDEMWEEVLNTDTYDGELAGFRIIAGFDEERFTKQQLISIIELLDEEMKDFEEYRQILVNVLKKLDTIIE